MRRLFPELELRKMVTFKGKKKYDENYKIEHLDTENV